MDLRSPAYRTTGFDRATERRDDPAWLAASARTARAVPMWRGRNLVTAAVPPVAHFPEMPAVVSTGTPVFLGIRESDACALFAVEIEATDEAEAVARAGGGAVAFADLRAVGGDLPALDESILAQARALAHWRAHARHCGACGAPTQPRSAGHVLACSADGCGREHFPRTDPATIALVYDGAGRALLGRNASWPERRYSALAGFVEPGESLEDTVAREVREEAGIEVTDVSYVASQPWPYPLSLMLGFFARAVTTEIHIGDELEDARWFSRDELPASLSRGDLSLPAHDTIARRLIEMWLAG